ncbi:MAG: hypothetical protein KDB33_18360 [Acidimicrobiales bacterium]|nr:hypothetical protein [Acidimicrobiales bacterium]MCB1262328.1 hypothetical protein [Acidimicrobiales bacterium]
MASLAQERSTGSVVLIDAMVLRDMGAALNGVWRPADEEDPARARRLVAAARLRLYGTRDRTGWLLVAIDAARAAVLRRGDADWSVGYVPAIESFTDAAAPEDVAAMVRLFREDEAIDADSAAALAHAVLCEEVDVIVTDEPRRFRHGREGDLPDRLEIVDPLELEARLALAPGEQPAVEVPDGVLSLLGDEPWWVQR